MAWLSRLHNDGSEPSSISSHGTPSGITLFGTTRQVSKAEGINSGESRTHPWTAIDAWLWRMNSSL